VKNDKYDEAMELSQSMDPSTRNEKKRPDDLIKSQSVSNRHFDEAVEISQSNSDESVDSHQRQGKGLSHIPIKIPDTKKQPVGGFEDGEKVEAMYKGKSKYCAGRIVRVRDDGSYDINYDDGEKELMVKADMIRSLKGSSSSSNPAKLETKMESKSLATVRTVYFTAIV
jgi:hypothetical protein